MSPFRTLAWTTMVVTMIMFGRTSATAGEAVQIQAPSSSFHDRELLIGGNSEKILLNANTTCHPIYYQGLIYTTSAVAENKPLVATFKLMPEQSTPASGNTTVIKVSIPRGFKVKSISTFPKKVVEGESNAWIQRGQDYYLEDVPLSSIKKLVIRVKGHLIEGCFPSPLPTGSQLTFSLTSYEFNPSQTAYSCYTVYPSISTTLKALNHQHKSKKGLVTPSACGTVPVPPAPGTSYAPIGGEGEICLGAELQTDANFDTARTCYTWCSGFKTGPPPSGFFSYDSTTQACFCTAGDVCDLVLLPLPVRTYAILISLDPSGGGVGGTEPIYTVSPAESWSAIALSDAGEVILGADVTGALWVSLDAGSSYSPYDFESAEAWNSVATSSTGERMVAVAGSGAIAASSDFGSSWTTEPDLSGPWSGVAMDCSGDVIVAVRAGDKDSSVYSTVDGGQTYNFFFPRSSELDSGNLVTAATAISCDGQVGVVVQNPGYIYVFQPYAAAQEGAASVQQFGNGTYDGRFTRQEDAGFGKWASVTVADEGDSIFAVEASSAIVYTGRRTHSDSGYTWTSTAPFLAPNLETTIASSRRASELVISQYTGLLYLSIDQGDTWLSSTLIPEGGYSAVAVSGGYDGSEADGGVVPNGRRLQSPPAAATRLLAMAKYGGRIYASKAALIRSNIGLAYEAEARRRLQDESVGLRWNEVAYNYDTFPLLSRSAQYFVAVQIQSGSVYYCPGGNPAAHCWHLGSTSLAGLADASIDCMETLTDGAWICSAGSQVVGFSSVNQYSTVNKLTILPNPGAPYRLTITRSPYEDVATYPFYAWTSVVTDNLGNASNVLKYNNDENIFEDFDFFAGADVIPSGAGRIIAFDLYENVGGYPSDWPMGAKGWVMQVDLLTGASISYYRLLEQLPGGSTQEPTAPPSLSPPAATSAPSAAGSPPETSPPTAFTTDSPTGQPSARPPITTDAPTGQPSARPSISTDAPTGQPLAQPSISTDAPTGQPSAQPSIFTDSPTGQPSALPSTSTDAPTGQPSAQPSTSTDAPTGQPSAQPSTSTDAPTGQPSALPSISTDAPTGQPSALPSTSTDAPTGQPSALPSTSTDAPTGQPSALASISTDAPTGQPSAQPSTSTDAPTGQPSAQPSISTDAPTGQPSALPSISTDAPTGQPSAQPSIFTDAPTGQPFALPSTSTDAPTGQPSALPSTSTDAPTGQPSAKPSTSNAPTGQPSAQPTISTDAPTGQPPAQPTISTDAPTGQPSAQPSISTVAPPGQPSAQPSNFTDAPTGQPSALPSISTNAPTVQPSALPSTSTDAPTGQLSAQPSTSTDAPPGQPPAQPTISTDAPTGQPSAQPSIFTDAPTGQPSALPSTSTDASTGQPSAQPSTSTDAPTGQPSAQPSASATGSSTGNGTPPESGGQATTTAPPTSFTDGSSSSVTHPPTALTTDQSSVSSSALATSLGTILGSALGSIIGIPAATIAPQPVEGTVGQPVPVASITSKRHLASQGYVYAVPDDPSKFLMATISVDPALGFGLLYRSAQAAVDGVFAITFISCTAAKGTVDATFSNAYTGGPYYPSYGALLRAYDLEAGDFSKILFSTGDFKGIGIAIADTVILYSRDYGATFNTILASYDISQVVVFPGMASIPNSETFALFVNDGCAVGGRDIDGCRSRLRVLKNGVIALSVDSPAPKTIAFSLFGLSIMLLSTLYVYLM